jgi:formate-dependent nitrite reductase membrane component NrfD
MNIKVVVVSCFLMSTAGALVKYMFESPDAQAKENKQTKIIGIVALVIALLMLYLGIKSPE